MRRAVAFLLFSLAAAPAHAWGGVGHRIATDWAIEATPQGPWRRFLEAHRPFLVGNSTTADRRRANELDAGLPPAEAPRHFIDIEYWTEAGIDPERLARPPEDAPGSWGRAPWAIRDGVDSAAGAMRRGDWLEALRRMAEVAHYAEDICVPLHTTWNHDGQRTGQHGVHARWEADLVERLLPRLFLRGPPRRLANLDEGADPRRLAWDEIRRSHAAVPAVLRADSNAAAADREYGETYEILMEIEAAGLVEERLDAAAALVARLWHVAWVRAGRPRPPEDLRYADPLVLDGRLVVDEENRVVLWRFDLADLGTEPAEGASPAGARRLVVVVDGETVVGVAGRDVPLIGSHPLRRPPRNVSVDLALDTAGDGVVENNRLRLTWGARRR